MPSSSCLCKVHSEFFNAFNNNLIKMWSSAKKNSEYRHLAEMPLWRSSYTFDISRAHGTGFLILFLVSVMVRVSKDTAGL